jgi:dUTP pyrophosphatase|tara:strand:+ start:107 stop:562 length:456 start_codon:yes stop_codon:yes gene_type:complete
MIVEYAKVHPWAHTPSRANPSDAGLDVCYSPEKPHSKMYIATNTSRIIPTGLKFAIPHGYMLEVKNRSSIAAKRQLLVGACVIDSGYEGEVFVNLHNIGVESQVLKPGDKIAQLVLIPVVHFRPVEISESTLYSYPITISERGEGALGSTG